MAETQTAKRTVTVRVILSVEVDPDVICSEYGIEDSPKAIRDDVKWTALNAINGAYGAEGAVVNARLLNAEL